VADWAATFFVTSRIIENEGNRSSISIDENQGSFDREFPATNLHKKKKSNDQELADTRFQQGRTTFPGKM
jgi:hypothetical protein